LGRNAERHQLPAATNTPQREEEEREKKGRGREKKGGWGGFGGREVRTERSLQADVGQAKVGAYLP